MNPAPIDQLAGGTSSALATLQTWVASPGINVLYKAFALAFVVLIFGAIPSTRKFTLWATGAIVLLLMIQPENVP